MSRTQVWPHVKVTIDDTGTVVDTLHCFDEGAFLARLAAWKVGRALYVVAVRHRDLGLRLGGEEAAQLATVHMEKRLGLPQPPPIVL